MQIWALCKWKEALTGCKVQAGCIIILLMRQTMVLCRSPLNLPLGREDSQQTGLRKVGRWEEKEGKEKEKNGGKRTKLILVWPLIDKVSRKYADTLTGTSASRVRPKHEQKYLRWDHWSRPQLIQLLNPYTTVFDFFPGCIIGCD